MELMFLNSFTTLINLGRLRFTIQLVLSLGCQTLHLHVLVLSVRRGVALMLSSVGSARLMIKRFMVEVTLLVMALLGFTCVMFVIFSQRLEELATIRKGRDLTATSQLLLNHPLDFYLS